MEYRRISDDYTVSGQITPEQVAEIKAAGYKTVICNRPDDEQPDQPLAESIRAAVEAAGLTFRHIPVVSGRLEPQNVEDMAQALGELDGPVFAYCRSGTRCTNLYALVQQAKD